MEAVTGATVRLLSKLGGLLQEEYKLQDKVKKDIESLQKELIFMNATLLMVAEVPPDRIHPLVKTWANLIRELSYDMEDVVSTFIAELHSNGPTDLGGFIVWCMKASNMVCKGTSHHRIAGMIEEMKSLTKELTDLRDRYHLHSIYIGPTTESLLGGMNPGNGNSGSSEAVASRTVTYDTIVRYLLDRRQVVHTELPVGSGVWKLMDWIKKSSGSENYLSVLSIVGFSGVGKTTIATALYQKISTEFDCRAFVTLSQNYNEDRVLRDILCQIRTTDIPDESKPEDGEQEHQLCCCTGAKSLMKTVAPLICAHMKQGTDGSSSCTENNLETMRFGQLVEELKRRLSRKRYLLLIDDVYSVHTWENIKNWLPHDNTNDSKVIVTTRFHSVGTTCSRRAGTDYIYRVDPLSHTESHSLFNSCCETVSTRSHAVHGTDTPGDIWKYCGGLPLAIVSIAGLVGCNHKKTSDYWIETFKLLFPEKVDFCTMERATRILEYCYNDMPADLKTCTLYLGIFPMGMAISKKRLTRRWISECLVTEKQGLTAEQIAESYFNQLISRKIIRPVDHNSNGKVKSFKVHHRILEHIVSKQSEENFITVVGGHWLMPTPSSNVRRLSVQISGSTEGMNLSHVRSFSVFGSQNQRPPFHLFNNGLIQVLDLEGWRSLTDKHLKDICKMVRLKYLSLRRTKVAKVPLMIEKLQYLETLDIRETNVVVLPRSFVKMKLLCSMLGGSKKPWRALKLLQGKTSEPMKAIRILSGIQITDDDSATVEILHQLTCLRKLAIYKLDIQEGSTTFQRFVSSIERLCSCGLDTLAINNEGYDLINSLDSMSAPPIYLTALELSGKIERMPKWIQDLRNLYKLTLSLTVLDTYTFKLIQGLGWLFSLTFTLSAAKNDCDILEESRQLNDREIIVPARGFESLKLLRFFATTVPRLNFSVTEGEVMPALERIDMHFQAFRGIYGFETLQSLREVHLAVGNQADETTKLLVKGMKDLTKFSGQDDSTKLPKIIFD